ncbi:MAG: peptidyl-tRNA hydrolase [Pirellula sp.]|nr:peptidyl-tRNA hydrolase [Pirellula sp.]
MEQFPAPNIKQVIVMRHDLKMRRGKQIAQGAHASLSFLTRRLQNQSSINLADFSANARAWIMGSFAKVCVRCNSEPELMAIYTCLAIGPDDASRIDEVTGHLELL